MLRLALTLGLLSAVGPFAIDMYLPALPLITEDLGTTTSGTQATLIAYFLAFGLAQLIYGPWADQAGRKLPLYAGISVFVLGTVGCVLAPSLPVLIAMRFLQGLGIAAVMVIPRAIIRDRYTGAEGTRLMAMVMLVIAVSPMLAPLAGAMIMQFAGWRGIFGVLGAAGFVSLVLVFKALPETLPPERRAPARLRAILAGARILLTDPTFMGLTFIGGFGMASFFVYIASASFVFVDQFGLSPTGFSLAFALNAVGFFSFSQLAAPLAGRIGLNRTIAVGVGLFAACMTATTLAVLAGQGGLAVIVIGILLGNAGLGLVIPTTMVRALVEHGAIAGLASSLGGTLQMITGGGMIALSGLFFDGTSLPMLVAITACSWGAALLTLITLPRLTQTATP